MEQKRSSLWEPGEYAFEILPSVTFNKGKDGERTYETNDKPSRAGNPMFTLVLKISNTEGKFIILRDWLVSAYPKKLVSCMQALGLKDPLKIQDFIGKKGRLLLTIEKDDKNNYPDSNRVQQYVNTSLSTLTGSSFIDDEIPF